MMGAELAEHVRRECYLDNLQACAAGRCKSLLERALCHGRPFREPASDMLSQFRIQASFSR